MSQTLQPLDHNAEVNSTILEDFQKKYENVAEEEMLKTLTVQSSNRLWTDEEQACLLYFHGQTKGDFEELQSKYFKHRTLGALKVRYEKVLKGHATPSHTPRPSMGNISKTAANAVLNMLTPEVTKETAKINNENVEDLLNELNFDDDEDENEEEEENVVEDAKPVAEEETISEETETVEAETNEESAPADDKLFFILPILMLIVAISVIFVTDPELMDIIIQSIQAQVTEWMETLQTMFK